MATKRKIGEVFALPTDDGDKLFGRVLLDVLEQCVKPKRILASSPLTFFKEAQLVEVSRDENGTDVIIKGAFVHPVTQPRIADRQVDPAKLSFPWTLSLYGPRPQFYWGELRLPVPLAIPEFRKLEISPSILPLPGLQALAKSRQHASPPAQGTSVAQEIDLRASPHRARIAELVSGRVLDSYCETAVAYGYDPRRFYDPEAGAQELLLCTYCNARIAANAKACTVCVEPTGRDALISTTAQELALEDRMPCKSCTAPILKYATICRWCQARQ